MGVHGLGHVEWDTPWISIKLIHTKASIRPLMPPVSTLIHFGLESCLAFLGTAAI
jgi:hypothetical protein